MGLKGEVHFVKMAGARLLQGPVMVRSRLWDGEIEIATIPDYCAYLRVMSWVDIFDVTDTTAVRARYEEERALGGYEIPDLRGHQKRQLKILMSRFGVGHRSQHHGCENKDQHF
jgi:hypothetical protein